MIIIFNNIDNLNKKEIKFFINNIILKKENMENNNIYSSIINEYKNLCRSISNYEKYLNDIYTYLNSNNIPHKGYLIDLKEFEKLKEDLDYQLYKTKNNEYEDNIQMKIVLLESENKSYQLNKIEKIELFSSDAFFNLLDEKNEYIFINTDLWRVLCKKGKENDNYIQ